MYVYIYLMIMAKNTIEHIKQTLINRKTDGKTRSFAVTNARAYIRALHFVIPRVLPSWSSSITSDTAAPIPSSLYNTICITSTTIALRNYSASDFDLSSLSFFSNFLNSSSTTSSASSITCSTATTCNIISNINIRPRRMIPSLQSLAINSSRVFSVSRETYKPGE